MRSASSTVERVAPPRGTRPRNRRALILAAATDLFHARGYGQVSMSDVAAAVNVQPSALYRHFAGKPQLFTAALVEEMTPIRNLLSELADAQLTVVSQELATAALTRSRLGMLWQREARGLPPDDYTRPRSEVVASVTTLADLIAARRERLLHAAVSLFAERGYSTVSMEDIGARAGITGASVYYHFESKQALLAAVLTRGAERLRYEMYQAFRGISDPAEALGRLLGSYVDFAVSHSDAIDVLITEARHLDAEQRAFTKHAQREYIGEWVHLMRAGRATLSEPEAKVRVSAVLTMANDIARTPRLRVQPSVLRTLNNIGLAILTSAG